MASDTESHKAIKRSWKIIIYSYVNDHGGMYETYDCNIQDRGSFHEYIYIHVDHIKNRITLGRWGCSYADILAVLNGDTKTLDQMDIQSSDKIILGRLHQNTVVSAASNSAILECISQTSEEAVIRDPRTNVVLAKLFSTLPCNPSKIKTIVYQLQVHLDTTSKILILLLTFKMFKETALRPKHIIPSLYYTDIDDLATIQNVSISKSSSKYESEIKCSYFTVFDMPTSQQLLTLELCGSHIDGFQLKVFNCKGKMLFTAEHLARISDKTKVFVNNKTEIGYTQHHVLQVCAMGIMAQQAELNSDRQQGPTNTFQCYKVRRRLTSQHVATITPENSTAIKRVTVDIHPAVDNVHKALLLTHAMKMIVCRYHFMADGIPKIKSSRQTASTASTIPEGFKEPTSLSSESFEDSSNICNPAVALTTFVQPLNVATSTNHCQSNEARTFHSQNHHSPTAYHSGHPLYTTQPTHAIQRHPIHTTQPAHAIQRHPLYTTQPAHAIRRHRNIQQPYFTGLRYPGHQLPYTAAGVSAGQLHPVNPPINIGQQPYANQINSNYQSAYTRQGDFGGYSKLLHPTQPPYGDQIHQCPQTPYDGLLAYVSQMHQGPHSTHAKEETIVGRRCEDAQSTCTGEEADASQRQPDNQ